VSAPVAALPSITRKNHGRGHSYYLDGVKVPGATTILGDGYPKRLENWAANEAAKYAVNHWDELSELGPADRIKPIADARHEDRDKAARRGTEVHRYARRLAAGEEVDVPDELVGHVDAYLKFAEDWLPREVLLETTVAHTVFRYCGTLDIVADLVDGNRWLLDLKTTRSGIFKEAALQLAAYRFCDVYLDADGVVRPFWPEIGVQRCGAVWLRADRSYEFCPVDATPATFNVFAFVKQIAEFDGRDDVVGAPLTREEE